MLSPREEQILLLLKKFDFMTRDQLNQYFDLGLKRNTNRVLFELSDHLLSIREGYQTIYYLSKKGRSYVDCEKIRKRGNHMHHVMRNDMWLHYDCPPDWKNEIRVSDGTSTAVVDAMFTNAWGMHFLEVDNMQSMKENRNKIKRYKSLMGNLESKVGHMPTIVWLTTSEYRKAQLAKECEGLQFKVFTVNDIK